MVYSPHVGSCWFRGVLVAIWYVFWCVLGIAWLFVFEWGWHVSWFLDGFNTVGERCLEVPAVWGWIFELHGWGLDEPADCYSDRVCLFVFIGSLCDSEYGCVVLAHKKCCIHLEIVVC